MHSYFKKGTIEWYKRFHTQVTRGKPSPTLFLESRNSYKILTIMTSFLIGRGKILTNLSADNVMSSVLALSVAVPNWLM